MTPLGWAAVGLGALAVAGLAALLRRLSRVAPDFSPPGVAPPASEPAPGPAPEAASDAQDAAPPAEER